MESLKTYANTDLLKNNLNESNIKTLENDYSVLKCRNTLCDVLLLGYTLEENSKAGNFFLGILDGLVEFPGVIELIIESPEFRELFIQEIKNISLSDFFNSIKEIFEHISNGNSYNKGRALSKILILSTGIGGLLKQFGCSIVSKGATISITRLSVNSSTVIGNGVGHSIVHSSKKNIIL